MQMLPLFKSFIDQNVKPIYGVYNLKEFLGSHQFKVFAITYIESYSQRAGKLAYVHSHMSSQ